MNNLWWDQVPNANRFINRITDTLKSNKNILLVLPDYVPWYEYFCTKVKDGLKDGVKMLDVLIDSGSAAPGEIVMRKYCREEDRRKYRPSIGYPKFLSGIDNTVLPDRYIWIKDISEDRFSTWIKFVTEYYNGLGVSKKDGARFIVELRTDKAFEDQKGIEVAEYNQSLTQFDRYIFNALLVSSQDWPAAIKDYLAELISEIAQNNIELAAECGSEKNSKNFLQNPYTTLLAITQKKRSDGTSLTANVNEEDLDYQIWTTQIKTVFPVIEQYRSIYINRYRKELEEIMPIKDAKGYEYENVNDVEIGPLYYCVSSCFKTSSEDFSMIEKCRDARNDLAHLTPISFTRVAAILNKNI